MTHSTAEMPHQLECEQLLGMLAGGLDPTKVDLFLDSVIQLAAERGAVVASLLGSDVIRLKATSMPAAEVEMPLAAGKLRMVCARIAVRYSAWCGRDLSTYGDEASLVFPGIKRFGKIRFINTSGRLEFEIQIDAEMPHDSR